MDKQLMELKQKETALLKKAQSIQVVSQETLSEAVAFTSDVKEARKRVDEIRHFFVDPLNEQVKNINAKFKPFIDTLDNVERDIKQKITAYQIEQDKKRREEEERLRREQQKKYEQQMKKAEKKDLPPPPPPAPVKIEAPKVEGLQMRKVWDFEIIDVKKIPQEYLMPNEKKIRKVVQAGVREIPGIRIFEKTLTAIK